MSWRRYSLRLAALGVIGVTAALSRDAESIGLVTAAAVAIVRRERKAPQNDATSKADESARQGVDHDLPAND